MKKNDAAAILPTHRRRGALMKTSIGCHIVGINSLSPDEAQKGVGIFAHHRARGLSLCDVYATVRCIDAGVDQHRGVYVRL